MARARRAAHRTSRVVALKQKRPSGTTHQFSLSGCHDGLGEANVSRESYDVATKCVVLAQHRRAEEFGRHLDRGLRSITPTQRGVDRKVHRRVQQEGVHTRLDAAVWIAGQLTRQKVTTDPTEVLAVDAVVLEGPTDGTDEGHPAVTQPTRHVFL